MAKKKYSVNWENDEVVSFEVDGVLYDSLDDIPDENDREKLEAMVDGAEFDDAFKNFDKETQKSDSKTMENVILRVFSAVAMLMLLIAGISSFFNLQKIGSEKSADGVVVDMVKKREYINQQDRIYTDYYFPVVRFTAADGKTREVQMTEGSNPASYEKGESVTVLYNAKHPLDARIESISSDMLMWILPGITGILGFAFGGAVLVVKKVLFDEDE